MTKAIKKYPILTPLTGLTTGVSVDSGLTGFNKALYQIYTGADTDDPTRYKYSVKSKEYVLNCDGARECIKKDNPLDESKIVKANFALYPTP